tara:strand:- start:48 stop:491 length:444 start_codon:yes stop_codon:yes gene_type:complete
MRKIYFDNFQSLQNGILLGLAILCFIISGINFFTDKIENLDSIAMSIGHLFLVLFWGKMFFFRNYVSWNKVGLNIRIKKFIGKSFSFKKIKNFRLEGSSLKITKIGDKEYTFDLSKIEKSSREKLIKILDQNTVGNNGSSPIGGSVR